MTTTRMILQLVREFQRNAASQRGRFFHSGGQFNVTPTSQSISVGCHAISDNWMIPFVAHSAAETTNAFQWARQLPKIALPMARGAISTTI